MPSIINEISGRILRTKDSHRNTLTERRLSRWTLVEHLRPLLHAATKRLQIAQTAALNDEKFLAYRQLKQSKRLFEELQSQLGTIDKELSHRFVAVISYLDCCMRDVDADRIGFARDLLLKRRDILTEIIESALPTVS